MIADPWDNIWHQIPPLEADFEDQSVPMQQQITVQQLQNAARTFKKQTAIIDGWHPRQFQFINKQAASALARIMTFIEFSGHLPSNLDYVLVKQLPKPTGVDVP